VAEHGRPAAKAEPSKAILFAIVAGVISLSFSIVILFLIQYFNNKISTVARFVEMTGLQVLGGINSIKSKTFNVDEVFADQEKIDPVKAAFLGNVRQIRYTLEQSNNKVYLFTSNLKGEGKTVALISIAYSIALLKKKVLIIDTNFKNNTITNIFSAKAGIMNFIHSEKKVNAQEHVFADYETADDSEHVNNPTYDLERVSHTEISNRWIQQITPSPLRGVDVIGCEKSNLSPSEIFAGKPFDNFLEEVKHYYDYIFFEGPALNDYSDSKELSAFADRVILVVSADRSLNQNDDTSFNFLESLKDQFFGCIVNNTNHEDDK
jgi:Mrp family chromosome partitioning ATPase